MSSAKAHALAAKAVIQSQELVKTLQAMNDVADPVVAMHAVDLLRETSLASHRIAQLEQAIGVRGGV